LSVAIPVHLAHHVLRLEVVIAMRHVGVVRRARGVGNEGVAGQQERTVEGELPSVSVPESGQTAPGMELRLNHGGRDAR